jgi:hypothetical protein
MALQAAEKRQLAIVLKGRGFTGCGKTRMLHHF